MDGSKQKSLLLIALAAIFAATPFATAASDALPTGWEEMEIEAKWEIDEAKYNQLVSVFADGAKRYGYTFNVRWGGVSRKFIDVYYDNLENELSVSLHSLRHRTRWRSRPAAAGNDIQALDKANWNADWERLQYKSTPCRIDATWFRKETGDCTIRDSDTSRLCITGKQLEIASVLGGSFPSHSALVSLGEDHKDFSLATLRPRLHVFDYRYRVIFEKNGQEAFEMSLDRVYTTNLRDGGAKRTFEAELEILVSDKKRKDVNDLLSLANVIQRDFSLTPSTRSKGGLSVTQCAAGQ